MVLLLVAGIVLSRITLRTVNRATATEADAAGSARERRLRKIYKAVLPSGDTSKPASRGQVKSGQSLQDCARVARSTSVLQVGL